MDFRTSQTIDILFSILVLALFLSVEPLTPLSLITVHGLLNDAFYYQLSNLIVRHTENLL